MKKRVFAKEFKEVVVQEALLSNKAATARKYSISRNLLDVWVKLHSTSEPTINQLNQNTLRLMENVNLLLDTNAKLNQKLDQILALAIINDNPIHSTVDKCGSRLCDVNNESKRNDFQELIASQPQMPIVDDDDFEARFDAALFG